ncbi:MAG: LysR family transcriptional regulator [Alphaproteobacteria bacterium]|nr:LysR family transcriptional regulator [Alphaproteobacteria bacterium]
MGGQRKLRLRLLFGPEIAVGPGKVALLKAIGETGSISAAARELGMSYRRAWLLCDTMNRCFRSPVVEANPGGKGGGGARVTALGEEVLKCYDTMERTAIDSVSDQISDFSALLAEDMPMENDEE